MAVAIESDVRQMLDEFEPTILDAVHSAWSDWLASPHRSQIRFRRTRANLVHDFMVHKAVAAFDSQPDVHIIHQDETAKFLFKRQILVRLKKGDANCLGSNIETQAVLAFTDPQLTIPGLPDVQKIDIVYVLNDLETAIERVAVTARDNNTRLWTYDIADRRGAPVLPLPQPSAPIDGAKVVRLRQKTEPPAKASDDKNIG